MLNILDLQIIYVKFIFRGGVNYYISIICIKQHFISIIQISLSTKFQDLLSLSSYIAKNIFNFFVKTVEIYGF